jgi:hypothetical protein
MLRHLKPHLPLIVTAVVVAILATAGPVAARAAFDALNAHKVDGFHAVGAAATPAHRAGKLVATNGTGRLPNNIISKAPNSARLNNLPVSAFASKILYSNGFYSVSDASYCPTAEFTPSRRSYALVQVDIDVIGGAGGGAVAMAAAYEVDGGGFVQALPEWNTGASAPQSEYAGLSNSGVVNLVPGSTYRFAGKGSLLSGTVAIADCKVIVQIMPKLPGTTLTPAPKSPAATQQRRAGR